MHTHKLKTNNFKSLEQGVEKRTYNPSTQEAKAEEIFPSSRSSESTQPVLGQPMLHETLSLSLSHRNKGQGYSSAATEYLPSMYEALAFFSSTR